MKKVTAFYLFASILVLNIFFNIHTIALLPYTFAVFIAIMSNNTIAYAFFAPSVAFSNSPLIMFSYAIVGFILFIYPQIQNNTLAERLNTHFLKTVAPFYIVLTSGFALYFTPSFVVMVYAFLLFLMFSSKNIAGLIIFVLPLTFFNEPILILLYILGYLVVLMDAKLKEKYEISKSNVIYSNFSKSNDDTHSATSNKTETLSSLINELKLLKENIKDNSIKNSVIVVLDLCQKIQNNTNANNEHKINKLINYYAPELISIIKNYIKVEKNDVISEENLMFKVEVMRILDTVTKSFDKILQSLLDTTIEKSSIDIKVLEKILKDDNLL